MFDGKESHPPQGSMASMDLEPRVVLHYGIPSTASVLAFDPVQQLLAIGTLDGRIKVVGGDNIEALLISPKSLPFKNLEFLQNQGFLVSVSNENDIQVWDLDNRLMTSNLQWESNVTAFSVICGTHYMYIGDEYGCLSVLKYDAEGEEIIQLPYQITTNILSEAAGIALPNHQSIVGVLPQPCSSGNRMVIAHDNGLIVLWDFTEDRAVLIRGYKALQLKDSIGDSSNDTNYENENDPSDQDQAEKEISSLCWAASDGSVLAVGYVDGDILLWNLPNAASTKGNQTKKSSNDVVKLQLSSGNRRLPVIVLHWSASTSHDSRGGLLFIYGGDEIGSEEVLTILSLDWSSGKETLKCVNRMDLTLGGSFADMILASNAHAGESSDSTSLFVLTNPGELYFYDNACLSALKTEHEKKHSIPAVQYPAVIPTVEPYMTVGRLQVLHTEGSFSRDILEIISASKHQVQHNMTAESTKWPLTGGVPSQLTFAEDNKIERLYVAGYQDGYVRIWDATFPVLSLVFVLEFEVEGINIAGSRASISALDFSSPTFSLAIGNECGLVFIYTLVGCSGERSFHFVTETKHQVDNLSYEKGFRCTAMFSLLNSPVRTLLYVSGARLAVGFECGKVAMLDVSSMSLLFLTDSISSTNSAIISLAVKTKSLNHSKDGTKDESEREVAFTSTRDAHIVVMDTTTGNIISSRPTHTDKESTAISLYILDDTIPVLEASKKRSLIGSQDLEAKSEQEPINSQRQSDAKEVEYDSSIEANSLGHRFIDASILLCCEDALYLYSSRSLIQGGNFIHKVDLVKPCCWTSIVKKDEKECGLIMVYQTGALEIRSLPDLEVVGETSLMSVLRWNFKANMDRTMSSSQKGQISLVNGCEFAFLSLFAFDNDFRLPEALPSLYDKVLAAAADAASNFSKTQKKKQASSGIIGGIIKGFKGGKPDHSVDPTEVHDKIDAHLEGLFSRIPFSDQPTNVPIDQELELNIDDIHIDEPLPVSSSSLKRNNDRPDTETERERLFEGSSSETQPRFRTPEEIMAKYRKSGDATTSAAAQAKNKLMERQEKLENISRRTEELQSGAENFASMANELAKTMEKRKWWNF